MKANTMNISNNVTMLLFFESSFEYFSHGLISPEALKATATLTCAEKNTNSTVALY